MKYSKIIKIWLFIGLVMVFIQVIVGGITRLTESGLSITKWEVVTGILPPISGDRWNDEFMKYKQTPQYREINEGMSLEDFKFIYFWEYIHRLWARMMGFVFLIPFIYFLQ
ncbi:MAG: COX15/CtaA family protein [Saprospiraceae bacterium]|nr:COX15/CtaA family protein [Saprospiraceae bacterium]